MAVSGEVAGAVPSSPAQEDANPGEHAGEGNSWNAGGGVAGTPDTPGYPASTPEGIPSMMDEEYISVPIFPIVPVLIDSLIVIIAAVAVVMAVCVAEVPKQPFICNEDIRREYIPPKQRFIPLHIFFIVTNLGFVLPIIVVEAFRALWKVDPLLLSSRFWTFVYGVYRFGGGELLGLLMNVALCLLAKHIVGRHAPNFLSTCYGEISRNCSANQLRRSQGCLHWYRTHCDEVNALITYYECEPDSGTDYFDIRFAQMSFYSFTCSYSMHIAVYNVLYLHARMKHNAFGSTLRPFSQVLLLLWSLVVGSIQYAEFLFHISDVVVGFAFGIATALYSALCIASVFNSNSLYAWTIYVNAMEEFATAMQETGSRTMTSKSLSPRRGESPVSPYTVSALAPRIEQRPGDNVSVSRTQKTSPELRSQGRQSVKFLEVPTQKSRTTTSTKFSVTKPSAGAKSPTADQTSTKFTSAKSPAHAEAGGADTTKFTVTRGTVASPKKPSSKRHDSAGEEMHTEQVILPESKSD